ncbi:glutamate receptor ionotropic, kainate 2-like [Branchiostoma floridae]|uniref:Glutamate receptor ionotropic, kainate 2-like n=1 Tax=Branchiostoma floridae TaxID=7739 RepID=A0A9J7MFP1_BRAFL|nr:glutamate receptor ionotropic, kainate 2-like [Branchiostoma floridae]
MIAPYLRSSAVVLVLLTAYFHTALSVQVTVGVVYTAGNKEAYSGTVRQVLQYVNASDDYGTGDVTLSIVEQEANCSSENAIYKVINSFRQQDICNIVVINNDRKSDEGSAPCSFHNDNDTSLLALFVSRPSRSGVLRNSGPGVMNLYPEPIDLSKMVIDTVQKYRWTSAFVLYDKFADSYRTLEQFLNWAADRDWLLRVKEIPLLSRSEVNRRELRELLVQIRMSREVHVILMTNSDIIVTVLEKAVHMQMLNYQYQWVITSLNGPLGTVPLEDYEYSGARMTFFHPNFELGDDTRLFERFVNDAVLTVVNAAADMVEDTGGTDQCLLHSYATKVEFEGYSGTVAFNKDGIRDNLQMDLLENKGRELKKVGTWSSWHGTNLTSTFNTSFLTNPVLGGKKLKIITKPRHPYVQVKKNADAFELEGEERFEGYLMDLIRKMALHLNFTYSLEILEDAHVGEKQPDGSWDGMIGLLFNYEVDVVLDAVSTRSFRLEAVDFTEPIEMSGYYLIMKRPSKAIPGIFQFLAPFSTTVWIVIGCACLLVAILSTIISYLDPYEWHQLGKRGEVKPDEGGNWDFLNSMWSAWGAFVGGGAEYLPCSYAGRVLSSTWWFVILVVISSYTANLAAFLTQTRLEETVSSLEELASSKFDYGALARNTIVQFLQTATDEPYKTIGNYLKQNKEEVLLSTRDELLDKAAWEKFVYIADAENAFIVKDERCELITVGEKFFLSPLALMLPRGSPYTKEFNRLILEFRENGFMDILHNRWFRARGKCDSRFSKTDQSVLGLESFAGLFYFMLMGIALTMLVLAAEKVWFMRQDSKDEKRSNLELADLGGAKDGELDALRA